MTRIVTAFEAVSRFGAWVGGALLLAASALIGVEVLLRKLFSVSLGGADELSSYALAISTAWSLAYALFRKAHIRVDVLYVRLAGAARSALDLLSLAMLMLFMAPLTWYALKVFQTSMRRGSTANTPLQTPLWLPQGLWLVGLAGFTLAVLVVLIITVIRLARGEVEAAQALAGATTLEEEIEEESGIRVGEP
jgi:TRAP-type C4-dicarboxylate transport system permease small subunit